MYDQQGEGEKKFTKTWCNLQQQQILSLQGKERDTNNHIRRDNIYRMSEFVIIIFNNKYLTL